MTSDAAGLKARFATVADAPRCNALYNRLHGTARTDAQWRWEFAPDGKEPFAYVVLENEDAIVGLQALIPIKLLSAHGVHETAKSEDTLLDPSVRGKGGLALMYELIFERAHERSIESIWGFTEATRVFEKLGFTVPAVTRRLVLPLGGGAVSLLERRLSGRTVGRLLLTGPGRLAMSGVALAGRTRRALARRGARHTAPGVRIETATAPPSGCGELMQSFVAMWGGITLLRDEEYLAWRVFSNPWTRPVMRCAYDGDTLLGWAVYAVDADHIGYVVDLVVAGDATSGSTARAVTRLLLADAADGLAGSGAVAAVLMTATPHAFEAVAAEAARALGFLSAGNGNPAVLWTRSPESELAHFDDWYVTRIFTEGVNG
ncbi:MAG: GNAT family N-acetyltransferase [Coriobacteriia bacterium]